MAVQARDDGGSLDNRGGHGDEENLKDGTKNHPHGIIMHTNAQMQLNITDQAQELSHSAPYSL